MIEENARPHGCRPTELDEVWDNPFSPLFYRTVHLEACREGINLLKKGIGNPDIKQDLDTLMDLINNYPTNPFFEETDCILQLISKLTTYFYQKGCLMHTLKLRDIKNCVMSLNDLEELIKERKKDNDKN